MDNRLDMRDFVNIGIFLALNLVLGVTIAIIFGTNPFTFLLIGAIGALVNGITMMVFFAKIKKKNVFLIYVIIYAFISLFLGMGYFPAIGALVFGILGEVILRTGKFASKKMERLAYSVYSLSSTVTYIPFYFASKTFIESRRATYGDVFADGLTQVSQKWIFLVLIVGTFVCGFLGALIGSVVFKKHFEKSGIV